MLISRKKMCKNINYILEEKKDLVMLSFYYYYLCHKFAAGSNNRMYLIYSGSLKKLRMSSTRTNTKKFWSKCSRHAYYFLILEMKYSTFFFLLICQSSIHINEYYISFSIHKKFDRQQRFTIMLHIENFLFNRYMDSIGKDKYSRLMCRFLFSRKHNSIVTSYVLYDGDIIFSK